MSHCTLPTCTTNDTLYTSHCICSLRRCKRWINPTNKAVCVLRLNRSMCKYKMKTIANQVNQWSLLNMFQFLISLGHCLLYPKPPLFQYIARYSVQYTQYTARYSLQYTQYTARYTVQYKQYTIQTVHCQVHCTIHTVYCQVNCTTIHSMLPGTLYNT